MLSLKQRHMVGECRRLATFTISSRDSIRELPLLNQTNLEMTYCQTSQDTINEGVIIIEKDIEPFKITRSYKGHLTSPTLDKQFA